MRTAHPGRWTATVWLLSLLCLGAPRARAGATCPKRPTSAAAAQKLASQWWRAAVVHHNKGQNLKAIAAWQCAYKLAPHPLALYNIGRSAVIAGKVALAVRSYEEYLRLLPKASNRAEVESSLRGLRKQMPRRPPPERRVTPPVRRVTTPVRRVTTPVRRRAIIGDPVKAPKAVDRGRTLRVAGWSVLGLGVAVAGLAGAFGGLAAKAKSDVEDAAPGTPYSDVRSDEKRAKLFHGMMWVTVGVSIAAVTTGAILLGLGYQRRGEQRVTIAPVVLTGGAAVTLRGTF